MQVEQKLDQHNVFIGYRSMKHSVKILLLALAVTTASAALASTAANAQQKRIKSPNSIAQKFLNKSKNRPIRIKSRKRNQKIAPGRNNANSRSRFSIQPKAIQSQNKAIQSQNGDNGSSRTNFKIAPGRNNQASKNGDDSKTNTKIAPAFLQSQNGNDDSSIINPKNKTQNNNSNGESEVLSIVNNEEVGEIVELDTVNRTTSPVVVTTPVQKTEEVDIFAPPPKLEAKEETPKVEIPTVFNETQLDLFGKLSPQEQVVIVKKMVDKYGYDSMYPGQKKEVVIIPKKRKKYHTKRYYNHGYNNNYYTKRYYNHGYNNSYNNHGSYRYNNHSNYRSGYRYNKRSNHYRGHNNRSSHGYRKY
jgi:hypothetical protein